MRRLIATLLMLAPLGLACDLPRDPAGTLRRVEGGTMRVGVIDNPPWAGVAEDGAVGVEAELLRELANELGAQPAWVAGPAPELLEALERRELDVVIGGLTDSSPWKDRLSFTRPFFSEELVVGLPPGASVRDVEGLAVAVELGRPIAAHLRERGAVPAYVRDLAAADGPVAAPAWRLPRLGKQSSGIVLHEAKHVMAVPRGENGWLVRLERFLRDREPAVQPMLSEAP